MARKARTPKAPKAPKITPFRPDTHEGGHAKQKLTEHGEIVAWSTSGQKFPQKAVKAALAKAGLDENMIRDLKFRHGFARACSALAEERIIDLYDEDESEMRFQFTKREKNASHEEITYKKETMLTLDKAHGTITCKVEELAQRARDELAKAMECRTPSDITRIVQKMFESQADLFAIRDQGGAYFVPHMFVGFVDKVNSFLNDLGGSMRRYTIAAGRPETDRSVHETVSEGMKDLREQLDDAVESFGLTTREDTLAAAADRINALRFKLETYKVWLGDNKAEIDAALTDTQAKLTKKIKDLSTSKESKFQAECDHCGKAQGVPQDAKKWDCLHCHKTFFLEQ